MSIRYPTVVEVAEHAIAVYDVQMRDGQRWVDAQARALRDTVQTYANGAKAASIPDVGEVGHVAIRAYRRFAPDGIWSQRAVGEAIDRVEATYPAIVGSRGEEDA